jgi:hypothetical protein
MYDLVEERGGTNMGEHGQVPFWRIRRGRRQWLIWVGAAAGLFVLAAAPARANDMSFEAIGLALGFLAAFPIYSVATWLIEAGVLNAFFRVGYWECVWYAAAANVVSTGVGLLWLSASGGKGWKMALASGQLDRLALLLVRSFLVTVAIETMVVMLMVRKWMDARTALKAVATANGVSYALTAGLLAMLRF